MKLTEALLTAPRTIEFREREIPPLTGSQVLVQVSACGVCTTEIPVWLGKTQGAPGASHRYWKYPSSLGHEVSGEVSEVGPYIKGLRPGNLVTGIAYSGSGFSTHVIEDEKYWVKIPEGFKPEEVLGEPLACIHNILNRTVHFDEEGIDNILIVGDGFMSIVFARLYPWPYDRLTMMGHHESRLKLAPDGTTKINSNELDAYKVYHESTFGEDCDKALDFTGTMSGLQLAASLCKPKNRTPLLMCGVYDNEPFTLGHYMVNRGVVPIPCYPAQSDDFPRDLRNGVTPETIKASRELITHTYKLEELGKAFEDAMGRRGGYIKGVIKI